MNPNKIEKLIEQAEAELRTHFAQTDKTAFKNQKKVLNAFQKHRISDGHFNNSTGYGYNDKGREALDLVWADVFESEAAFVRPHIVSGTHAITIGLFGLLRPGDTMLSVTGTPYDTLTGTIGLKQNRDAELPPSLRDTPLKEGGNAVPYKNIGSLFDFGIKYRQTEITDDINNPFDYHSIGEILRNDPSVKVIFVQKSKGYKDRLTIKSEDIGELVKFVKSVGRGDPARRGSESNAKSDSRRVGDAAPYDNNSIYIVVDNCYGELVEEHEPTYYGADMIIGSLIKNPGGGIAECGGYIAGTKKAVELAAYRLTSPLVGTEVGASLGQTSNIYKGLFFAPHVVAQSLKTARLAAYIYEKLGYEVSSKYNEPRYDIIQAIKFGDKTKLINFVRGIQYGSAIDSHVTPEPCRMPGYDCEVIMASGSFTQGSSIEISADAPIKPPYIAYLQGGLTYESGKLCLMKALEVE